MNLFGKVRIIMLKGEKGDKGDAGESGDYSELTNKPSINNHELNGNSTSEDLGLVGEGGLDTLNSRISNVETEVNSLEIHEYTGDLTLASGDRNSVEMTLPAGTDVEKVVILSVEQMLQGASGQTWDSPLTDGTNYITPYYMVDVTRGKIRLYVANHYSSSHTFTVRARYMILGE